MALFICFNFKNREIKMAFDVITNVSQNKIDGSYRKEILVKEAFAQYGGDQSKVDDFLATRYKDAGYKTPLEMAEDSEAGLETAKCLLKPRSGC
jgi:hypothetical protein